MGIWKRIFGGESNSVKIIEKRETIQTPLDLARAYTVLRDRLYSDLPLTNNTINADLRLALAEYRAAGKHLAQNNAYANRYLDSLSNNVVGNTGFVLKVEGMDFSTQKKIWIADSQGNDIIETGWLDWCQAQNLTSYGNINLTSFLQLIIRDVATSGEAFVHLLRGRGKYGLQLELIPALMIDETYTEKMRDGSYVLMGIEFDKNNTPQAYWMRTYDPTNAAYSISYMGSARKRIPATDMIHIFHKDFSDQIRGMTWFAPVIRDLHMLVGMEEAALVNARVTACKSVFIKKTDVAQKYTGDTAVDSDGNRLMDVAPGMIEELQPGQDVAIFDPKFPEESYGSFVKTVLKKVAAGLNISYSTLTGDMSENGTTNARVLFIEERNYFRGLQMWLTEVFLKPVYREWLRTSLTTQSVKLPIERFDKFSGVRFIGRSFPYLDPRVEGDSNVQALQWGLKTYSEILGEQGKDFIEHITNIKAEREALKTMGLEFGNIETMSTESKDETENGQE